MYRSIFHIISNKYLLTFLGFAIWVVFFDSNSLISRQRVNKTLDSLENQKQYYIREINRNKAEIQRLDFDTLLLEQIGREKYLMKKDSEDIFIVVRK